MKTMICATLVAPAATASIDLPAAADEATASDTGAPFAVLNGIATLRMSAQDMAATRGSSKWLTRTSSGGGDDDPTAAVVKQNLYRVVINHEEMYTF